MCKENLVIVLAGTRWQIPLVKKLKERGYKAVVFNLLADSPAFAYSDDYRVVDILDYQQCLAYARELQPVAVMSEECDIAMPTVAWLSEKLHLNSIGTKIATLYTDKYEMRKFGLEHGFDTPFFVKCATVDAALEIFRQFGSKMIIKPLNSNSSRGVYTINCEKDIEEHFEECIKYSRGESSILIEEYIEGTEFTIDGIKTKSGHICLAISEKRHYGYNENIASSLYFSYYNPSYDYDKLRKTNDEFVNLSGLPFGLTHAEYKYKGGKFYLMQIGYNSPRLAA